jgi:hypothetical protein
MKLIPVEEKKMILRALIIVLVLCLQISSSVVDSSGRIRTCGFAMAQEVFPELQPFSVQMHMHGHSNHNGSSQPGSMQWHFAQASINSGTDVLWWTDHTRAFKQFSVQTCNLPSGTLDRQTMNVTGLAAGNKRVDVLAATVSGRMPKIAHDESGLRIGIESGSQDWEWQRISYEAKGKGGAVVKSLDWNKPLGSGAIIEVDLACGDLSEDNYIEVSADLSWHYYDSAPVEPQLVFRFVPDTMSRQQVLIDNHRVLTTVPCSPEQKTYELDLLSASSLLNDGEDNTLVGVRFDFAARNGATLNALFRSFTVRSRLPEPVNQLKIISDLAKRYETQYGLYSYIGVENGAADDHHTHISAYLPYPIDDISLVRFPSGPDDFEDWSRTIHEKGGLTSLAHVLGTATGTYLNLEQRQLHVMEAAERTLGNRAFGADLMEVGYVRRGGCNIRDHLKIWDILTANGLFLVGNGVTDTHGGLWSSTMLPNAFTTWVYSTGSEASSLIDGLREGHAYFGNIFLWDGTFALKVGDARMGDRVEFGADSAPLTFQFEPWPDNIKLFLVQGLIRPGMKVEYLHRGTPVISGEEMVLDTTRACFVRLEAYLSEDGSEDLRPVAFTNPVILLRPIAGDSSFTTDEGIPIEGMLTGIDHDGDPLTYTIVRPPRKGILTLKDAATGAFRYQAGKDATGNDSFTFRVNDGNIDSNTAAVSIIINPVNDLPVAFGSLFTTDEDTPFNGTLQAADVDQDRLTYRIVEAASQGTVTLNDPATGAFTYAPLPNATGNDSFTFLANDGSVDSNSATISIVINPVNDSPVAIDGRFKSRKDRPMGGDLLATDVESGALSYTIMKRPAKGSVVITDPNKGSFVYMLNRGATGEDYFTFMANDGFTDSNVARVTIVIDPANISPYADAGPDQLVDEKEKVILQGAGSRDSDDGIASYNWVQTAGLKVVLSKTEAVRSTFVAPKGVADGQALVFRLTVTDNSGLQSRDHCIINVADSNAVPHAKAGKDQVVSAAANVVLDGSGSRDSHGRIAAYLWTQISGRRVELLNPKEARTSFIAPEVSPNGASLEFLLTVTDSGGLRSQDTCIVNIVNGNLPPIAIASSSVGTASSGKRVTLNGKESSDPEGGFLAYRWTQLQGTPVTLSDPTSALPVMVVPWVSSRDRFLVWRLTVTDAGGLQSQAKCTLEILP